MGERLSAVTVYHRPDFDFLRLQARSLQLYAERGILDKIIIIENFDRKYRSHPWHERRKPVQLRSALMQDYGDLADLVEFRRAEDFYDISRMTGWRSQQIMKLAVSRFIETEKYFVLDAKNHLVHPLHLMDLVADDGRAFMGVRAYHAHPLRPFLESSLKYFDLDIADFLSSFPQPVTPFTFYTGYVRQLISLVESREGKSFPEAFVLNNFTEFFVYCVYVISVLGSIDNVYCYKASGPVLWPHLKDQVSARELIAKAENAQSSFFSLHRLSLSGMPLEVKRLVAEFWVRRNLFADLDDAHRFLRLQSRRHKLDDYAARVRKAIKSVAHRTKAEGLA